MASQPLVTCMKGLFLIFNFVFWLTGLGLLIVGILTKYAFNYLIKLSTDINYNLAPYIMIGCGVFIILVGFLGCWASIKEHSWALKLYMFILIVLFLFEIGGAIAGYILRNKLSDGLQKGMRNAVDTYYNNDDSKSAMDQIQEKIIKCCGVESYTDYFHGNTTGNSTTKTVPSSCCINTNYEGCYYKDLDKAPSVDKMGIYTNGCYEKLLTDAKKNFVIVGGVALGIAFFQLLGVACAYILTKQFKEVSRYETM